MDFTEERVEGGGAVDRRTFELQVDGETVPGVLWSPHGALGPRPLVLMGHGGSQHKKTGSIVSRARAYARQFGYATMAIDAPGHGDRISRREARELGAEVDARVRGHAPLDTSSARVRAMLERSQRALGEWKAALDAAQTLDFIGANGPVGYWGVSMGTAIGVPFVAAEPRITCAVFGLAGLRPESKEFEASANAITIPIEFVFQWDDVVASRDMGVALFNAFASKEKAMHINPGGHLDVPDFERLSWEAFFARHLGVSADASIPEALAPKGVRPHATGADV